MSYCKKCAKVRRYVKERLDALEISDMMYGLHNHDYRQGAKEALRGLKTLLKHEHDNRRIIREGDRNVDNILECIGKGKGLLTHEICKQVIPTLSRQTVQAHLKKLKNKKLICQDKYRRYFLAQKKAT